MDIEWLIRIVQKDDEGRYPSAERALRSWLGCFDYKASSLSVIKVTVPRISDPEGLLRSLHNQYSGPAWSDGHYRHKHHFHS